MPTSTVYLHLRSGDSLTVDHQTWPGLTHAPNAPYSTLGIEVGKFDVKLFIQSPEDLRALALAAARAARDLEVAQLAAAFEAEHPEYCLLCPCEPTDYVASGHRDGCPYHCEYCTQIAVKQTETIRATTPDPVAWLATVGPVTGESA
jgi:hypothetical protein